LARYDCAVPEEIPAVCLVASAFFCGAWLCAVSGLYTGYIGWPVGAEIWIRQYRFVFIFLFAL
jgi:hypothetical protein